MSEFHVQCIQLGKIGKHPNADSLSITSVRGNYPVILKTGSFSTGDKVVHIPPDAIVDTTRPEFDFLASKANAEGKHRVKFCKIRQIPSFGFLIPAPRGVEVGQDVQEMFGIEKYDDDSGNSGNGSQVGGPSFQVPHYDIESVRNYGGLMVEGEEVIITEKIHGMNGRWVIDANKEGETKLFCGSRRRFVEDSVWNQMAKTYDLERIMGGPNSGRVLFGEVYGGNTQDLNYQSSEPKVVFFDIYDRKTGLFWSWDVFEKFCAHWGLPTVPVLWRGPYLEAMAYELAEGNTILGCNAHVREGVVVKPKTERHNLRVGRVFLKLVGTGYLGRKSAV